MKKIRIGKDIRITWEILTNGEQQSLEGRDLKLVLTNPLRSREELKFSVESNRVVCKYLGVNQKQLGVYTLTLWENFGQPGQTAVDACKAFQLVPTTCLEGGVDEGLDMETVSLDTANLELLTEGAPSTVSWNNVTGKPELFPPSQHNHEISDVNNLNETLDKQSKELTELSSKVGDIDSILDNINGEVV